MGHTAGARRDETLDVARGLAVLLMVWVHLVPDDGPWTAVWAFDALPAAMFTMLVGVSAAAGGVADRRRMVGRVAKLVAVGLPFWRPERSTEMLIPIACMLPIVHVLRARPRATWTVVAVALALVPLTTWWWGGFAWREVRGDGTHEANHSVGWHTLRYFVLHGAYPLLPWVVLPLLGLRFARARSQRRQLLGWLLTGLVCVGAALLVDARWGDAYAGGVSAMLDVTWQPTSVPFVMLWGGASMAALATVYLLDVRWRVLAVVGRWSLPHYLVHLVVVYSSMRIWWPAEDWSWGVGAGVAVGYIATACLLATASPRPRCRGENHNR